MKITNGQIVDIVVITGRAAHSGTYHSEIINFPSDSFVDNCFFSLMLPSSAQGLLPLCEGDKLQVYFTDENLPYSFDGVVLEKRTEGTPYIILEFPGKGKLKKAQRREYARSILQIPVSGYYFTDKIIQFKSKSLNISGGGMLIETPQLFTLDKEILVTFEITDEVLKRYEMICRITHSRRLDTSGKPRYVAGIAFRSISTPEQDAIIKFLFNYETKKRNEEKSKPFYTTR